MACGPRHVLTLLLLAATACETEPRNIEQPSERDLVQECLKSHPRASSDAVAAGAEPIRDCKQDSGACMASSPCTGELEDRECDPAKLISDDAAVCIAEAAGLDAGLNGRETQLVYNLQYRRIIWSIMNTQCSDRSSNKCESADESGEVLHVDAVSGEVIASLGWLSIS